MVSLGGHDHYLGKYGSAASKEAYRRLAAEWLQSGGTLSPTRTDMTVVEVIAAYLRFARAYYRKDGKITNEVKSAERALSVVKALYGRSEASTFGPLALKTVREAMIEKDWCRLQINKQVDRIKRVFKWAVSEELVPSSVYESLRTVTGLRKGRSKARESLPVRPVEDSIIEKTIEHLPAIVADMVKIQRLTGARPGELCDMRPVDFDRSSDVWRYVPKSHKTEHHGQSRVVFIGERAQAILLPYLLRPEEAFCFSPIEANQKRRELQSYMRVTPMSCGNRPGSNRRKKPRRKAGDQYTPSSYGRAIRRAAEAAGITYWTPHQLRHSFPYPFTGSVWR